MNRSLLSQTDKDPKVVMQAVRGLFVFANHQEVKKRLLELLDHPNETTNVWHIDPKYDKGHSAVFPLDLCRRVIKYYSFVDDLVFDPFAGSGTLGRAAISLNRYFFLIEKESISIV